jgi:hypothetical protein
MSGSDTSSILTGCFASTVSYEGCQCVPHRLLTVDDSAFQKTTANQVGRNWRKISISLVLTENHLFPTVGS